MTGSPLAAVKEQDEPESDHNAGIQIIECDDWLAVTRELYYKVFCLHWTVKFEISVDFKFYQYIPLFHYIASYTADAGQISENLVGGTDFGRGQRQGPGRSLVWTIWGVPYYEFKPVSNQQYIFFISISIV